MQTKEPDGSAPEKDQLWEADIYQNGKNLVTTIKVRAKNKNEASIIAAQSLNIKLRKCYE